MANLRTTMDAAFWDLNISSPQNLDGVARAVPGDPVPLDGARASKALRIQQIYLLGNSFPLGIVPSFSPPSHQKELGSFALQSVLGKVEMGNWAVLGPVRYYLSGSGPLMYRSLPVSFLTGFGSQLQYLYPDR
ncbi:hypothetical protein OROHE_004890 [Orobanche hederae]